MIRIRFLILLFALLSFSEFKISVTAVESRLGSAEQNSYGVDVSYPVHHEIQSPDSSFNVRYRNIIEGCYLKFSEHECLGNEKARLSMNIDQPSIQHNYTEHGFETVRAPQKVWDSLSKFFNTNKKAEHEETWPRANTYVNYWDNPSYMINLDDTTLRGGFSVKQLVWEAVKEVLEDWTGVELEPVSIYGIRVYKEGAILSTHVDRLPLVTSAIINVAQDVDEPWPLEVYGHDGFARNITMNPGDMVLYESHTVLHGRPFPLKGRFYANVFVHFQPKNHSAYNEQDYRKLVEGATKKPSLFSRMFGTPKESKLGGHEQLNHPSTDIDKHIDHVKNEVKETLIKTESTVTNGATTETKQTHQQVEPIHASTVAAGAEPKPSMSPNIPTKTYLADEIPLTDPSHKYKSTSWSTVEDIAKKALQAQLKQQEQQKAANKELEKLQEVEIKVTAEVQERVLMMRYAAVMGNITKMNQLLENQDVRLIHQKDSNQWQIIHEAVRGGDVNMVKHLISLGADLTSTVRKGGPARWVAKHYLPADHPMHKFLADIGAPEM